MATIHDKEVHFGEHEEARDFFKHPDNSHVGKEYLELAEKEGKAKFFAGGHEYEIRKEENSGEKSSFSIHRHY